MQTHLVVISNIHIFLTVWLVFVFIQMGENKTFKYPGFKRQNQIKKYWTLFQLNPNIDAFDHRILRKLNMGKVTSTDRLKI